MKRTKPVILKYPVGNQTKLQPLPEPRGQWPFRLSLEEVCGPIENVETQVFHLVGDTGSRRQPEFQRRVARAMGGQVQTGSPPGRAPHFLLHLGDIVYDHGEAEEYEAQFFIPYENYPAPVFALAGNHDADINPLNSVPYQSLDAFRTVFCDTRPSRIDFSGNSQRQSQIQPHVYFSLITPLANFICLYGNVTKFGHIDDAQFEWLLHELRELGSEKDAKALFLCLHHAPYSADTNHGSSVYMIDLLEKAFAQTGVYPDLVCSGHVHNYQRFSKHYSNGECVRFLVSGAGGYADLHRIARTDEKDILGDPERFDSVQLDTYCDTHHGFLKMEISRNRDGLTLTGEYFIVSANSNQSDDSPRLFEQFSIPLNRSVL